MLMTIFIVYTNAMLNFISISQGLIINCTGYQACENDKNNCINNEDCTIICNGAGSCESATFICPTSINTHAANECNLECEGDYSCRFINIIGGIYSKLNINASGDIVLYGSSIQATESSKLTLTANGNYAFDQANIACPFYTGTNVCNVIFSGNAGGGFFETSIFSNASFMGVNILCSEYSANNCFGEQPIFPMMYCTIPWHDSWCYMTSSDGINWNCMDPNNECYIQPTIPPSVAPTVNLNEKVMNLETGIIIGSILFIVLAMIIILVRYRCIKSRNGWNLNRRVSSYEAFEMVLNK
eukprot:114713_1